jgi:hypothetical protein
MAELYVGLLHYPVLNRAGETVASALTGLDLTDIARSARTYDVRRYYLITPVHSQQEIAQRLLRFWMQEKPDLTYRREALQRVSIVATLEDSLRDVLDEEGINPLLVGTSARQLLGAKTSYQRLRARLETGREPIYLLFGTGWGLAEAVRERLDFLLPPLWGPDEYNHLSVRAAAAIVLDRLRSRSAEDDAETGEGSKER